MSDESIPSQYLEQTPYRDIAAEFAIVERIASIVSRVRGSKPDYARLAAELEPAIPFDVFGVVLLRHDRRAVRITVCHRERTSSQWVAVQRQHPIEDSMLDHVLKAPHMQLRKNYLHGLDGPPATSGDALSGYHHLRSTLIVPLVSEDRVLGTLELGSTGYNAYADSMVRRLIDAVANVLASAIERVQLGGSAEIQNRQRQALKEVSTALNASMDLSTILKQLVVGIARALNVASLLVVVDPRTSQSYLEVQAGLEPAALERAIYPELALSDQTIIGYTLQHREPCVSQNIADDERFPGSRLFATELALCSIYSYPLLAGTTVYGALLLCSSEAGGFTPLKVDILSLFASQATIAIRSSMLLESAQLSLLAHTAQSSLVQMGVLSELDQLLGQVEQSAHGLQDAWFIIDLDGSCLYMNPAAEPFLGYVLPKRASHFMKPVSIESLFAHLLPRIRNMEDVQLYLQDFTQGSIYQRELRCTLAGEPTSCQPSKVTLFSESDPSDTYYQLARYPLCNSQGQVSTNALQVRNITEQIRGEQNKAALLSSVSHDLRTPLTTIKAAVTGLLEAGIPWTEAMRHEMLVDIDGETDRLTNLVNAWVEICRIEMGALMLEKEWCDLVEVVHETLAKAEHLLAGRPVYTDLRPSLPLVYVDHVQLGYVFYNVLEYAVHHSLGPIVISLDVHQDTHIRARCIYYGCDKGDQEGNCSFGSFSSLGEYSNGLGLVICKGIIEAHYGRIWREAYLGAEAEMTNGEGSCVVFTLPLHPMGIGISKDKPQ